MKSSTLSPIIEEYLKKIPVLPGLESLPIQVLINKFNERLRKVKEFNMLPESTRCILAAQLYLDHLMRLNKEGFADMLADDVTDKHCSIIASVKSPEIITTGKSEVVNAFAEQFFAVARNFDLTSTKYFGGGLEVMFEYKVFVDEDGKRYGIESRKELGFRRTGDDKLKIVKIKERTKILNLEKIPPSTTRILASPCHLPIINKSVSCHRPFRPSRPFRP